MKELTYAACRVTSDLNTLHTRISAAEASGRLHQLISSGCCMFCVLQDAGWSVPSVQHCRVLLRCSPHAKRLHGPTLILQLITPQQFLVFFVEIISYLILIFFEERVMIA